MTSIPGTKGTGPAPGSNLGPVPFLFSGSAFRIGRGLSSAFGASAGLLSGISAGLACSAPSAGSPSASVSPLSFAGSGLCRGSFRFCWGLLPVFQFLLALQAASPPGALFSSRGPKGLGRPPESVGPSESGIRSRVGSGSLRGVLALSTRLYFNIFHPPASFPARAVSVRHDRPSGAGFHGSRARFHWPAVQRGLLPGLLFGGAASCAGWPSCSMPSGCSGTSATSSDAPNELVILALLGFALRQWRRREAFSRSFGKTAKPCSRLPSPSGNYPFRRCENKRQLPK